MQNERYRVLLMDDEIASSPLIKQAAQALRDAGFDVTETDRMSAAMDAFYQRYYHIFILDIDMSYVEDIQDGDGSDVARFLRALDSETNVIFFSARGKVKHWFAAANYHLFGYVFKNETAPIQKLLELAQEAASAPIPQTSLLRRDKPPERAILWLSAPLHTIAAEDLQRWTQDALPAWEVALFTDLHDVTAQFDQDPQAWGLVIAIADAFPTRPRQMNLIRQLCKPGFQPHTIYACCGSESNKDAILALVNAHPFRFLDLLEADFPAQFKQSLQDAVRLYGLQERLLASPEALKRLRLDFSEDTYALLRDSFPDDEAWLISELPETPHHAEDDEEVSDDDLESHPDDLGAHASNHGHKEEIA